MGIKVNYGLLISIAIHILIMIIPVSLAVVHKFNEVELFVMSDEMPAIHNHMSVKKQSTLHFPKVREEIKKPEKPPIVEERREKQDEKHIEIVAVSNSNKLESVSLPVHESPNPPIVGVSKNDSALKLPLSKDTSVTHDVEFGTAIGPKFLYRELPAYPMIARKLGKEGKVVLRLTIDERGNMLNVEIVEKADYGFTEAAIEAVKRSTFLPANRDGKPVASRAILPIRFMLRRD